MNDRMLEAIKQINKTAKEAQERTLDATVDQIAAAALIAAKKGQFSVCPDVPRYLCDAVSGRLRECGFEHVQVLRPARDPFSVDVWKIKVSWHD